MILEYIHDMEYIHAMEYYSALKRKEIETHAIKIIKWMHIEDIMLSIISQTQKN